MKEYKEFKDQDEMYKVITFWSNCCGDLHHNGEYNVSEEQLPEELQRAYRELWEEGNGCLEYLLEYGGRYYVTLRCLRNLMAITQICLVFPWTNCIRLVNAMHLNCIARICLRIHCFLWQKSR